MLTIHALGSLALATLAEVHDGVLGSVHGVDLDLVVGVLDDGGVGNHLRNPVFLSTVIRCMLP